MKTDICLLLSACIPALSHDFRPRGHKQTRADEMRQLVEVALRQGGCHASPRRLEDPSQVFIAETSQGQVGCRTVGG